MYLQVPTVPTSTYCTYYPCFPAQTESTESFYSRKPNGRPLLPELPSAELMRQGVRLGSCADEPTTPDAPPPPAPCEAHSVRLHSRWTNPFRQLSATKSDSTRGKVRTSTSLGREFDGLLTPQGALPIPPEERLRRQPLDESDDLVPANSCADPGGTKPSKEDPREWRMSPCTPSHMRSKSSATPRSSLVELQVDHGETRDKQSNEDAANSGRGWTNPFAAPSSFSRDSPRSWKMPPSTPRQPSHPHPATPQPSVVTSTPKRPLARLLSLPSLPSCKYSRTTSGTPKPAARPAVNALPSAAVEMSEDEISDEDLKSRPEQTAQPQLVTPIAPARRPRQQLLSSQEQMESVQSNCAMVGSLPALTPCSMIVSLQAALCHVASLMLICASRENRTPRAVRWSPTYV